MKNLTPTPAEKLENGALLTTAELTQLRTEVSSMNQQDREKMDRAIDLYARKNRALLTQDVQTENALLALKTTLMEQAKGDKKMGKQLGEKIGGAIGDTVETTAKNAHALAYKQYTELMNPNNTWQDKTLRVLGIAAVGYGLYRAASWVLNRKSSWGTKLLKFIGVSALAGWVVNRVAEKEEAKKPTPAKKPAPKPAPVKKPVQTPAPVKRKAAPKKKPAVPTTPTAPKATPKTAPTPTPVAPPKPEVVDNAQVWIDDASLDGEDLLTTSRSIGIDGIETRLSRTTINGEEETVIHINNDTFSIRHATIPTLINGQLLKAAHTKEGELHIFGSGSFGAIQGDAYIAPEELRRVVHILDESNERNTKVTLTFSNKDAQTADRTMQQADFIFERL